MVAAIARDIGMARDLPGGVDGKATAGRAAEAAENGDGVSRGIRGGSARKVASHGVAGRLRACCHTRTGCYGLGFMFLLGCSEGGVRFFHAKCFKAYESPLILGYGDRSESMRKRFAIVKDRMLDELPCRHDKSPFTTEFDTRYALSERMNILEPWLYLNGSFRIQVSPFSSLSHRREPLREAHGIVVSGIDTIRGASLDISPFSVHFYGSQFLGEI